MHRAELEKCLADLRAKVIRGAKPTRPRRLRGYLKSLDGGITVSGRSHDALNPVPAVERDKEDQPVGEAEESCMSLSKTIGRFRRVSEGQGKTAKKPGDPGTDKHQSKLNKAAWAKMSPEQKKKYTGDTPMPSHTEGVGGAIERFRQLREGSAGKKRLRRNARARVKAHNAGEIGDEEAIDQNAKVYAKNKARKARMQKDEAIDFDRPPVESIFTESARLLSEHDERDINFAKAMLMDRVGLHHSMRQYLGEEEQDEEDEVEEQVSGARFGPYDLTGRVQAEANIPVKGEKSESNFRGAYPGSSLPSEDEEATVATSRSSWLRGPGYGKRGCEMVDVHAEAKGGKVSRQQIAALKREAQQAGDSAQVKVCDRALRGDKKARAECANVIASAAAMSEGQPMATGAFIEEEETKPGRRGRRRRQRAPMTEEEMDSRSTTFDPTKLKFPRALIGR